MWMDLLLLLAITALTVYASWKLPELPRFLVLFALCCVIPVRAFQHDLGLIAFVLYLFPLLPFVGILTLYLLLTAANGFASYGLEKRLPPEERNWRAALARLICACGLVFALVNPWMRAIADHIFLWRHVDEFEYVIVGERERPRVVYCHATSLHSEFEIVHDPAHGRDAEFWSERHRPFRFARHLWDSWYAVQSVD